MDAADPVPASPKRVKRPTPGRVTKATTAKAQAGRATGRSTRGSDVASAEEPPPHPSTITELHPPGPATSSEEPEVQWVTIHGYKRAYVMAGTGPAVLLIHGIGDNSNSWADLIRDLSVDHTVIAPDLLGHGRSDKPRADYSVAAYANGMRDLLAVLGVDRATIIGHSLGGGVAAQFAYQFPERCERLVLVSSGGAGREVAGILRSATLPGVELLFPAMTWAPWRWPGFVAALTLRLLNTDIGVDVADFVRVVDSMPDAAARRAFSRTLRAVVDWNGQVVTMLDRCYLAEGMPTLLVWGARDSVIPVAHAEVAHQAMPGSRLEIFSDAGHFPHHSDPARFAATVRRFLDETTPSEYRPEEWRDALRAGTPGPPALEDTLLGQLATGKSGPSGS